MKTILAALAVTLLSTGAAVAVEYRTPVTKQLFTCASGGVSRIAMTEDPAPCCEGQLKCAQYLATTGTLRIVRDPRT
ncbi:MAG: hypothetical protein H7Z10_01385 [Gemmatimonadaceae bacterium]|nr:hypothetical protein [Acetobacteraceae bacterium]